MTTKAPQPGSGERLRAALERTGFRASLAEEYTVGHAPAALAGHDHQTPAQATYYDHPALKKPEWLWYVPAYFFVGGLASGAYVIATLMDIRARPEDRTAVRSGYAIALAGMLLSPVLLIADLGRPERFLNMLRVFKPRSMMSMGSWGLTLFGSFSALALASTILQDLGHRIAVLRVVSWLGLLPAMFVGGYSGLLLSATNVPLWAGNRLLMGPLFLSSALSSGLAAVHIAQPLFGSLAPTTADRIQRAERRVSAAELALMLGSLVALGRTARPLVWGRWAVVFQFGAIGLGHLLPVVLDRLISKGRRTELLTAGLSLAGSAMLRLAVTEAGKQSADDALAYFAYTAPERP